ncbi:nucleotidyltransferase [Providencia rettgeri]|uniref:nucleotidyltransferase n=1 Tax=Morganellaceae TaxID=1903414 RepID=UPI000F6E8D40|nr:MULTISPECIES: nucleotidyltransferase [Providencia]MTC61152.1 nucleotidyltransferase [Providencia rustigianii]NIA73427.1 nucleotidyltransferase [Providencia rettgeri]NIA78314.1 nucleotidyltransferase [Providencia rettgeri]NIB01727.1 nucleotidyltransferase [Providencia rettgeri]NIB05779.1 nucleotidyltransferase [Providencia rettgeri]
MHIYAFGSICRGEVDSFSDVDMLAIVSGRDKRFNPKDYSIYSYERIKELWKEGNPFAWHLFLESMLIYSSDGIDYLRNLGKPSNYSSGLVDCEKFLEIFISAKNSIESSVLTEIFDLSSVFLSIRNFATCFSLDYEIEPNFSRNSAHNLGVHSIPICDLTYQLLERARVLCTRGTGEILNADEIKKVKSQLHLIESWMREKIGIMGYKNE